MTGKEYLSQAYRIDHRINSKIEQIATLRSLATKASAAISGSPSGGSPNKSGMENIIVKIISLEDEINAEIDTLVDLKREMISAIKSIEHPEQQTLLELRYLCYKSWEQIAVEMNYSIQHIFRLHDKAVKNISLSKR